MNSDLFGQPLQADPTVALKSVRPPTLKQGPLPRVQFVIEFVGPRSVPASQAAALVSAQWHAAFGQPAAWCMRPSDKTWQPLTNAQDGSYDSLALAWDIVGEQGSISGVAGNHLMTTAESFAAQINRRPMPMPTPPELDGIAGLLHNALQNLDAGFALMVVPVGGLVAERDLWILCSRLGLSMSPEGSFDWRAGDHPMPLFSITPIGDTENFSLGAVERGANHQGVTIGFSLPLSPEPVEGCRGCFAAANFLATSINGRILDDSGGQMTDVKRASQRETIRQAVETLNRLAIPPGSAEAIRLFG